MSFIKGKIERVIIRGIADYLLFGLGPDEDDRDYEKRLEEPYMRFEKAVAKYEIQILSYWNYQMKLRAKQPVYIARLVCKWECY